MSATRREVDLTAVEQPKYRDPVIRLGPEKITASAEVKSKRWTAIFRLSAAGQHVATYSRPVVDLLRVLACCLPALIVITPIGWLFGLNGYLVLSTAAIVTVAMNWILPSTATPRHRRAATPPHDPTEPPDTSDTDHHRGDQPNP